MEEELLYIGVTCHYDPDLFHWHFQDELYGLITIHLDDFYWGKLKGMVTKPFKLEFEIGKNVLAHSNTWV